MSPSSIPSNDREIAEWIGRQFDRIPDESDPAWRRKALGGRKLSDLMANVPTRAAVKATMDLGEYTRVMAVARRHGHESQATLIREALYEWAVARGVIPEDLPKLAAGK